MDALFVYGTLKRGQASHHLLGSPLSVRPASVRGRLLLHPDGYPVLEVPSDPTHPVAVAGAPRHPRADAIDTFGWRAIGGEVVVLRDPERRLALLDKYEEYEPTRPSPYLRLAVTAHPWVVLGATKAVPERVWTYVRGEAMRRSALTVLPEPVWSGRRRR